MLVTIITQVLNVRVGGMLLHYGLFYRLDRVAKTHMTRQDGGKIFFTVKIYIWFNIVNGI